MIIIVDEKADIGRYVVVHNMLQRYPNETVSYLPQANLALVERSETIFLLGHGGGGQVAHMCPTVLASELVNCGLKSGAKIEIRACHAGVPSSISGESFVDELASVLKHVHQRTVHVVGYTGTGVVQQQGSYRAKDAELNNDERQRAYKKIIASGKVALEKAATAAKELERLKRPIPEIAEKVAALTSAVFADLYEHNLTVSKGIDSGRHESSLAAYLKDVDPMWADSLALLHQIRLEEHNRWSSTTASYIA